jgi:flagellar hook-basal body complex protein FliE
VAVDSISSLLDITSDYVQEAAESSQSVSDSSDNSFDSVFQSALDLLNETNQLSNDAELEEIRFAMGDSENLHDLTIALQKAEVAIQYTVAVRDKVLDAYKEIMNMQI